MPTGQEIFTRAAILLNDESHTRWPLAELCEWLNEGVRAIVLAKPSASSTTLRLSLGIGTRQELPPTVQTYYAINTPPATHHPLALISLVRNVSLTPDGFGSIGGRMIKRTEQAALDAVEPSWHDRVKVRYTREVRNYCYDDLIPLQFYVYPGNDGTGVVDAEVGTLPDPLVANGPPAVIGSYAAQIALPEPYSVPLLDYVLYRCQMKDDIDGASGRAAVHYQQFATAIGLKIQVEKSHSPNARP